MSNIKKHILRKLAFLARSERRARQFVDLENRRRTVDFIHGQRHEFLTETIPALYGEIR